MNEGQITALEIDLIDACNLSCPLCSRERFSSKTGYLPLDKWINIISVYKKTRVIYFIGTRSEHTLYPEFLALCRWLKARNIKIVLSTNGCTNKNEWWDELGAILTINDEVRFAVDGTDQETYEKYRIGGDLKRVLSNHKHFKTDKKNDVLQYIEFEHNKHEDISEFSNAFSSVKIINSSQSEIEIGPRAEYKSKFNGLNVLVKKNVGKKLQCETKGMMIFINNEGVISPCCHYNEHRTIRGMEWDRQYNAIEDGSYDFCIPICSEPCRKFREHLNIEL